MVTSREGGASKKRKQNLCVVHFSSLDILAFLLGWPEKTSQKKNFNLEFRKWSHIYGTLKHHMLSMVFCTLIPDIVNKNVEFIACLVQCEKLMKIMSP